MNINNTCVYRHRRLDTFEIFYIGIGVGRRPYLKTRRNKLWHNIINKVGYQVEIIAKDLSWEDACELETLLIQEYGRKDINTGKLANMTNGGEGCLGYKHTEESINKIRHCKLGFKTSEITKLKLSKNSKNAQKVICVLTGKIWNSIKSCAEENNIHSVTLRHKLHNHRKNNTIFKFINNE